MEEFLLGTPDSNFKVYLIVGLIIGAVVALAVGGVLANLFLPDNLGELPKSSLDKDDIV